MFAFLSLIYSSLYILGTISLSSIDFANILFQSMSFLLLFLMMMCVFFPPWAEVLTTKNV